MYPWDEQSTYIKHPPFFETMVRIYNFIHEHDMLPYGTILICDNFPSAAKQSIRIKYLIKEQLNKSEVWEESENFNFY